MFTKVFYVARKFLKKRGYELVVTKIKPGKENYHQIIPRATYAPWLSDAEFDKAYETIRPYTLVDKYRCHELWQLVAETSPLSGALLEVGAWKGGTAALIAAQARSHGISDTVYVCDTFEGVVKAGAKDSTYKGGEHADTSVATVQEVLDKLRPENVRILKGIFPDDTAKDVQDEAFRFCHIDVDVYESAQGVFDWVWPRLVSGGIVVFDDYGFYHTPGVTRYVNEMREQPDRVVLHNLNGHAVVIKRG